MSQTDENPSHSPHRGNLSGSAETHDAADTVDLSDRQAVIAVMTANGLTCEDIALRLHLPLETVDEYLHQALEILGLSDVEYLTYVLVAAHYNRNAPTTRAEPELSGQPADASRWLEGSHGRTVPASRESPPVSLSAEPSRPSPPIPT